MSVFNHEVGALSSAAESAQADGCAIVGSEESSTAVVRSSSARCHPRRCSKHEFLLGAQQPASSNSYSRAADGEHELVVLLGRKRETRMEGERGWEE
ncbi:hypothetical protein E2562_011420 [Oryza meyeriana var. granulata]|uniref:Uncharacterized protein n=1 Tax=Oryza meyeriana var. granulata TaxID=110450 RepID=A0A6G1D254_9ORYZ|nr:hypothetical protein E2562_011420 [Oryza meyeriana var. granulata]